MIQYKKFTYLFCFLLMFGCASFQFENDLVIRYFNGKVKKTKTYYLKSTSIIEDYIEFASFDKKGRFSYLGYSEMGSPDSILRYTTYNYGMNFEEIIHYEGSSLELKERFFKKKSNVLYVFERQNERDTAFYYHKIDESGEVIMTGTHKDKGNYDRYKKYRNDGKIIEGGIIEDSVDHKTMKMIPRFIFIYNSNGCLVETKNISTQQYSSYFKNDQYCNLIESYGVNSKGEINDKRIFLNELDQQNNWVKQYSLNEKGDTLSIKVREIEYYK